MELEPPKHSTWDESHSYIYQDLAAAAVPHRAEQLATLLTLLPYAQNDPFHLVEIGSGEGFLSAAALACFPNATLVALDGSPSMQAHTRARLRRFGDRGRVNSFELAAAEWHSHLHGAGAVMSSLCLHHLPDEAKRTLFTTIQNAISPKGVLLIADLVEPQRPEAKSFFADTWDRQVRSQSLAHTGTLKLFDKFYQTEWNYYRYDDPADRPAPLFKQLLWLHQAGFVTVDCFWMQAGHAIYGGYKTQANSAGDTPLTFETALAVVRDVLKNSSPD